jgi:arsenate reductase-like glutaredoxin family protein
MDKTITFEKTVSFEMNFDTFKKMFNFPSEEMYEEVWNKMLEKVEKTKYEKFMNHHDMSYAKENLDEEVERDDYTINALVRCEMKAAYVECKAEYYKKRDEEIKLLITKNK